LELTSSTCGLSPSALTGAKSLTGSYGVLVVAGTMAITLVLAQSSV
jgi:hypothetical protein